MTFLSEKLYITCSAKPRLRTALNMKYPVLAKNKLMLQTDTVPSAVKRENNSSDDLATTNDAQNNLHHHCQYCYYDELLTVMVATSAS